MTAPAPTLVDSQVASPASPVIEPAPLGRPAADLRSTLRAMQAAQRRDGAPSYEARIGSLERLEQLLVRRKNDIADAISSDFGNRSRHETMVAEVFVTVNGSRYAREHLRSWMAPRRRHVSMVFQPGRAEVQYQPLGVVGIISPWNYPLQLALAPLVGAIAAGNRAMIKPSELVPETARLLTALMSELFAPDQVAVVTGGPEVGEAFSKLPFDHLVFTGGTRVGKAVMRAASENLTPVTLELGGKSPAVVVDDFPLEVAAARIMSGKLFNAGQTCIAPDYALVPEAKVEAFAEACQKAARRMYPRLRDNPDYTSIISDHHYRRLENTLDDARKRGARVIAVNPHAETLEPAARKLAPHLVLRPTDDMRVMQDEIFGPILPIRPYRDLGDAIDYVNDHDRPLALYGFTHDPAATARLLDETTSGGVSMNETMLHVAVDDLPFGGVGPSGMGHYHAFEGFESFSKKKPVFHQARLNATALLRPPFGRTLGAVLRVLLGG